MGSASFVRPNWVQEIARYTDAIAYSSPDLTMVARLLYLTAPLPEPVASRALTTSRDSWSATSPKTTWRPLSHEVTTVVTKNWEPLLLTDS